MSRAKEFLIVLAIIAASGLLARARNNQPLCPHAFPVWRVEACDLPTAVGAYRLSGA